MRARQCARNAIFGKLSNYRKDGRHPARISSYPCPGEQSDAVSRPRRGPAAGVRVGPAAPPARARGVHAMFTGRSPSAGCRQGDCVPASAWAEAPQGITLRISEGRAHNCRHACRRVTARTSHPVRSAARSGTSHIEACAATGDPAPQPVKFLDGSHQNEKYGVAV